AAEAVVDGLAKADVRDLGHGDSWRVRPICLVEKVEQARRGLDQVSRRAEAGVSRQWSEPNQKFACDCVSGVDPDRLGRRIVARHLPGSFNVAARLSPRFNQDGAGPQQTERA